MGFCEIVTERENAGTERAGQGRGSAAVRGLGEKCVLDLSLRLVLAARAGVVG